MFSGELLFCEDETAEELRAIEGNIQRTAASNKVTIQKPNKNLFFEIFISTSAKKLHATVHCKNNTIQKNHKTNHRQKPPAGFIFSVNLFVISRFLLNFAAVGK